MNGLFQEPLLTNLGESATRILGTPFLLALAGSYTFEAVRHVVRFRATGEEEGEISRGMKRAERTIKVGSALLVGAMKVNDWWAAMIFGILFPPIMVYVGVIGQKAVTRAWSVSQLMQRVVVKAIVIAIQNSKNDATDIEAGLKDVLNAMDKTRKSRTQPLDVEQISPSTFIASGKLEEATNTYSISTEELREKRYAELNTGLTSAGRARRHTRSS